MLEPSKPTATKPVLPSQFDLTPPTQPPAATPVTKAVAAKPEAPVESSLWRKMTGTVMVTTGVALAQPWGLIIGAGVGAAIGFPFGQAENGATVGMCVAVANMFTGVVSIPLVVGGAHLLGKTAKKTLKALKAEIDG